jgi:hypothetical protein
LNIRHERRAGDSRGVSTCDDVERDRGDETRECTRTQDPAAWTDVSASDHVADGYADAENRDERQKAGGDAQSGSGPVERAID